MPEPALEQRVATLEELMAFVLRAQERSQSQLDRLSDEMRAFKDEMRAFKDKVEAFMGKMDASVDRLNQRWGDLANKMGTLAEDIVAPSVPRIVREALGYGDDEPVESAVRVRRYLKGDRSRVHEFDVIAVCGEHFVVNETKSALKPEDVADFVSLLGEVRSFFPEQEGKKIVGALAALNPDESVVRHAERQGLLVLGLGRGLAELRNSPGFRPRER